jgi:hypothetical protein
LPEPTLKSSPASVPRVTPIDVPASELMVSNEISPTFVMLLSPTLIFPARAVIVTDPIVPPVILSPDI